MSILVTGATGYVGIPLVKELAARGERVKALCRSEEKASVFAGLEVECCYGDITDRPSLDRAMEGCQKVYHLASYARMWDPDPNKFWTINAEGGRNVLDAALAAGVRRVVFTSTAGVMGPVRDEGGVVHESTPAPERLISDYDRSKKEAEELALGYIGNGLEVVITNPSRIYGPGLRGESNSVSRLFEMFSEGRWRLIPGDGSSTGNYVYIGDVVRGHLQAMEKGRSGERYILGGENLSYNELFLLLRNLTDRRDHLYKVPLWLLRSLSRWEIFAARAFGKKPMIVPEFVEKLTMDWSLSSEKAGSELGYVPTPAEEGIQFTLQWLESG